MRGSLRVHSALTLALLIGWSLLSDARERIAPTRLPPTAKTTSRTGPPARDAPLALDPKLLN